MIKVQIKKQLSASEGKMLLDVDCEIQAGKITGLHGPSGVGKTSLLKIIAGLLKPDQGYISVNEDIWLDTKNKINLPPQRRKIGFVFQDYALFPNMTVRQNLEFALRDKSHAYLVEELIKIIDLVQLQDKRPQQLSGGQQQRVALARAIANQPKLLLLDEPLSALDEEMRQKLQNHLLKVQKQFNLTVILVSHDVNETIKLTDYVIELRQGKIARKGSPIELFAKEFDSKSKKLIAEITALEYRDGFAYCSFILGKNVINLCLDKDQVRNFEIGQMIELKVTEEGFSL